MTYVGVESGLFHRTENGPHTIATSLFPTATRVKTSVNVRLTPELPTCVARDDSGEQNYTD